MNDNLFVVQPKIKFQKITQNVPNQLKPQTIENAEKILRKKHDVYALQAEYLAWVSDKEKPRKGYEAGFIGFCKKRMPREEIQDDLFGF